MVQKELPLFGRRGFGRDRLAAERGRRLGEQPRPAEGRAADHHAIDAVAGEGLDHRSRRVQVAVADQRNPVQVRLDPCNSSQSAEPRNISSAVRPWTVTAAPPADSIAWATSMALIVSRVSPGEFSPSPARADTRRHAGDDLAHAIGIAQQIRAALGLFGNVAHRAAEVDVDHAGAKLLDQPPAHRRQRVRIVVPNLHGQRPRLVFYAPKPIGSNSAPWDAGVDDAT